MNAELSYVKGRKNVNELRIWKDTIDVKLIFGEIHAHIESIGKGIEKMLSQNGGEIIIAKNETFRQKFFSALLRSFYFYF